jgi:hypothetical protein
MELASALSFRTGFSREESESDGGKEADSSVLERTRNDKV